MTDYNTVPEAVEALKAGKVILVIDDPDRENEGDSSAPRSTPRPRTSTSWQATRRASSACP